MSPRWHRVLHAMRSVWHDYDFSAPQHTGDNCQWSVEDQEAWLAAKLRQLRRVSPVVESLTVWHTGGADVLADVLQGLTAPRLTRIDFTSYDQPVSATAMRALAGLRGLADASVGSKAHALPTNCGWAVVQLTALTWLWLGSSRFPADLPEVLSGLSTLSSLALRSTEPLPVVQPLTALGQLEELNLQEERASSGLAVLPAAAFHNSTELAFCSPLLKVRTELPEVVVPLSLERLSSDLH